MEITTPENRSGAPWTGEGIDTGNGPQMISPCHRDRQFMRHGAADPNERPQHQELSLGKIDDLNGVEDQQQA